MNQVDVVKTFVEGDKEESGTNIEISGNKLRSSEYLIAFKEEGLVFMSVMNYTPGVSRIQNLVRKHADRLVKCTQERFELLERDRDKAREIHEAFKKIENGTTRIYIR